MQTAQYISTNSMATPNAMISRAAQEDMEQRDIVNCASLTVTSYHLPFSISSIERKNHSKRK
jgi:hypothetical protein